MNTSTIVQKIWNYCNVLRGDGMSYGDYVEQPTYLLFRKMADERTKKRTERLRRAVLRWTLSRASARPDSHNILSTQSEALAC